MSEAYHTRPSQLLSIKNVLHAYLLDRAVFYFGISIVADLDKSVEGAKTDMQKQSRINMVFNRWKIGVAKGKQGNYKDPVDVFK